MAVYRKPEVKSDQNDGEKSAGQVDQLENGCVV